MQENTTTTAIYSTAERNAIFDLDFFAQVRFSCLRFKISDCFISVFSRLDEAIAGSCMSHKQCREDSEE